VNEYQEKWRGSFCHGFAPDQNSEMEEELGQSPADVSGYRRPFLQAVTPAKAGVQLSSCFHSEKRDASLRWHDGCKREASNNHQHWKRSDFKFGPDIG
jgi:hypothetical protein